MRGDELALDGSEAATAGGGTRDHAGLVDDTALGEALASLAGSAAAATPAGTTHKSAAYDATAFLRDCSGVMHYLYGTAAPDSGTGDQRSDAAPHADHDGDDHSYPLNLLADGGSLDPVDGSRTEPAGDALAPSDYRVTGLLSGSAWSTSARLTISARARPRSGQGQRAIQSSSPPARVRSAS